MANKNKAYSLKDLINGAKSVPDLTKIEILNTSNYKDGVFKTFNEFINNDPSITESYEIKFRKKIKLWITKAGNKVRIKEGVYGFAHKDQLYILFRKNFYRLQKGEDTFYFTGPHVPDQRAIMTGAVLGGAVGGAIAASVSGEKKVYKTDMNGGFIMEADEFNK